MHRSILFWWRCLVKARRGSAAFANDWQWLIGIPALAFLLWFFRTYVSGDTQQLLSGATAFGAFVVALIAFVLTMAASFVVRIFVWPPNFYYEEKDRADRAEKELKDRLTPRIAVFLDPDSNGITENPTESRTHPPQRGPS